MAEIWREFALQLARLKCCSSFVSRKWPLKLGLANSDESGGGSPPPPPTLTAEAVAIYCLTVCQNHRKIRTGHKSKDESEFTSNRTMARTIHCYDHFSRKTHLSTVSSTAPDSLPYIHVDMRTVKSHPGSEASYWLDLLTWYIALCSPIITVRKRVSAPGVLGSQLEAMLFCRIFGSIKFVNKP